MQNTSALRELGFTDGEIKVYYALFELGETTVGPLSKKSRVTHAKTYPILDKLIQKGLVSHVIKNGRKHFSATNPNSLLEFVDRKMRSLKHEKTKIKEIIPTLLAKQKAEEKTQYARVFEGIKGLRSLFYELFEGNNKKAEMCVLGLNREIITRPDFVSFFKFYHDLRRKNKIGLKLILSKKLDTLLYEKYLKTGIMKKEPVKYVDTSYPTGVFIFKDHVINIIAEDKVTAFDIKSRQNADRYRKFFQEMWKISKP